jgi:DNA-binding CsgD family transcriptional regulator
LLVHVYTTILAYQLVRSSASHLVILVSQTEVQLDKFLCMGAPVMQVKLQSRSLCISCGIASLEQELIRALKASFVDVRPSATWKLLCDAPIGWAVVQTATIDSSTIIVTDNPCPEYRLFLIEQHPAAVVSNLSVDDVISTLDAVRRGTRLYPTLKTPLTDAERMTLHLIARGHQMHDIARRRGVGVSTVRNTVSELYSKLQLNSHVKLALYYYGCWEILKLEHGWSPQHYLRVYM